MIDPKRFGLAAGLLWSLYMFAYTVLAMYTGHATVLLNLMASLYPGYNISWTGSLIGMLYGFVDGFVGLYLMALIYNKLDFKK